MLRKKKKKKKKKEKKTALPFDTICACCSNSFVTGTFAVSNIFRARNSTSFGSPRTRIASNVASRVVPREQRWKKNFVQGVRKQNGGQNPNLKTQRPIFETQNRVVIEIECMEQPFGKNRIQLSRDNDLLVV